MFLLFPVSCIYATNKTEQLKTINKNIKHLKTNIRVTHHKQAKLQQELKSNEIKAGNLALQLKKTQRQLALQHALLRKLIAARTYYQALLVEQQNDLAEQMRSIYMFGKQTYLKLLLNNEDPNQINRIFVYYYYLQNYRLQLINRITKTLHHLHNNKRIIEKQTKKLVALEQQQKQEYQKLTMSKQERSHLLHNINKQLKTQKQKLDRLVSDKKALEKIISHLKATAISADFATPLNKLHKKLVWPTKGKVEDLYGSSIQHSQLKWNGILINASEGQDVHVISAGRVVFAEWLQGYGLLMIINHGHGYMSLYGRNSSLYKKVGAIVAKGDIIAAVGTSGGYSDPSLYFAIRHDGKPVNPKLWCH